MSNIWDEDTVSEYELLADDAEEAERIAEEYDKAPEVVEPTEEEVESIVEEAAFELDDEESNVVYNARLRLEQARLYEMLINHNLFDGVDADPRAINIVQNELKHFIVKRLEILMGLRQPVIEKAKEIAEVDLPFNDTEVDFLKQLAYKGTLGKSAQGQPLQSTTKSNPSLNPLSSKKSSNQLKSMSKSSAPHKKKVEPEPEPEEEPEHTPQPPPKKKAAPKKQQPKKTAQKNKSTQQNKPQQKAKPAQKSKVNSAGVMAKRDLTKKEIEELAKQQLAEEQKSGKKDWADMTKKEKMQRIREVNAKYARPKPKDMLPMPTAQELEARYQQREALNSNRGGRSQFNATLANILTQRKNKGE